jgi:hypothetical protein
MLIHFSENYFLVNTFSELSLEVLEFFGGENDTMVDHVAMVCHILVLGENPNIGQTPCCAESTLNQRLIFSGGWFGASSVLFVLRLPGEGL